MLDNKTNLIERLMEDKQNFEYQTQRRFQEHSDFIDYSLSIVFFLYFIFTLKKNILTSKYF